MLQTDAPPLPGPDDAVHVAFRFTSDHLVAAMRMHVKAPRLARSPLTVRRIVWTIVVVLSVITLVFVAGDAIVWVILTLFLLLLTLSLMTVGPTGRWLNRRSFNRRHGDALDVQWTFRPQGLEYRDSEETISSFRWGTLQKAVRVPTGFLFYIDLARFHWVPFTAFNALADIERVAEWARTGAKKYVEAIDAKMKT